jgi:hypothetical protein
MQLVVSSELREQFGFSFRGRQRVFGIEIQQAAQSTPKNRLKELQLPQKITFIPTNTEVEKKEIENPALSSKLILAPPSYHAKQHTYD